LAWWRIALVWWAVPLVVLFGISLIMIVAGRERSTINDVCMIGASCLMTAVSGTALNLGSSIRPAGFLAAISGPWVVWMATVILAGYFWGTIPYVKTMIRERGSTGWYIGSMVYHGILFGLSCMTRNPWLMAFMALIALRAALVPKLWPKAKPKFIGIGEVVGTIVIILVICLTLG